MVATNALCDGGVSDSILFRLPQEVRLMIYGYLLDIPSREVYIGNKPKSERSDERQFYVQRIRSKGEASIEPCIRRRMD